MKDEQAIEWARWYAYNMQKEEFTIQDLMTAFAEGRDSQGMTLALKETKNRELQQHNLWLIDLLQECGVSEEQVNEKAAERQKALEALLHQKPEKEDVK